MRLINNKAKQYYKGNWGKPNKGEQGLRLTSIELDARRIPIKKKAKSKVKRPFAFDCCPFCHKELPLNEGFVKENKWSRFWYSIFDRRVKVCPSCDAREVKECPCCKCPTWHKDGWYKHQGRCNCGFTGKKMNR